MSSSFNFPLTNTINALIGTARVPYKSQNYTKYKSVNINCPIGVYFRFTNYPQQYGVALTITVSSQSNSKIQVYKNGLLH